MKRTYSRVGDASVNTTPAASASKKRIVRSSPPGDQDAYEGLELAEKMRLMTEKNALLEKEVAALRMVSALSTRRSVTISLLALTGEGPLHAVR